MIRISLTQCRVLSVSFILCFGNFASSIVPTTQGYMKAMPSLFWPYNNYPPSGKIIPGNEVDQNSPFSNPDVFCQQYDARLPSGFEYNEYLANFKNPSRSVSLIPTDATSGFIPHWTAFVNNDISSALKPQFTPPVGIALSPLRMLQIGSGLMNEWGLLHTYNEILISGEPASPSIGYKSTWNEVYYWITEPYSYNQRRAISLTAINFINPSIYSNLTASNGVVCVYDL